MNGREMRRAIHQSGTIERKGKPRGKVELRSRGLLETIRGTHAVGSYRYFCSSKKKSRLEIPI